MYISTLEAARRLKTTQRRVQQLIEESKLPAIKPARDYLVEEADLKLVENRRRPGRPPKERKEAA